MCITDENKTYTNVDFVAYEANFSIEFFIILNTKLSATRVAFFPMKLDVTLRLRWSGEPVASGVQVSIWFNCVKRKVSVLPSIPVKRGIMDSSGQIKYAYSVPLLNRVILLVRITSFFMPVIETVLITFLKNTGHYRCELRFELSQFLRR